MSTPPFARSAVVVDACTVTVAGAVARSRAGVYVRVPFAARAGCAQNSALLSLLTMKSSAWPFSSRRTRADRRRPVRHRLTRGRILEHRLVSAFREARRYSRPVERGLDLNGLILHSERTSRSCCYPADGLGLPGGPPVINQPANADPGVRTAVNVITASLSTCGPGTHDGQLTRM